MTKDDIIRMAREAGFGSALTYHKGELRLERFAELLEAKVRADEREATILRLQSSYTSKR